MSIKYRFDLYREGVKMAELTGVKLVQYGYVRNDYKKATLDHIGNNLSQEILSNLIEGSEIRIYRQGIDDTDLKLVWAGEIQESVRNIDDKGVKTIHCEIEPWGNIFFKTRFLNYIFTSQNEEDIAWGLIDQTQTDTFSGYYTADQVDFGIAAGLLEPTSNVRDRSGTNDMILTALQQLADAPDTGPTQRLRGFKLTPDFIDNGYLKFNYYANLGTTRSVIYTNPVILNLSISKAIRDYGNRITVTGKNQTTETSATNTDVSLNFFKMRQQFVSKSNIDNTPALIDAADYELTTRLNPAIIAKFAIKNNDPFLGKYTIGDTISVQFQDEDGFIDTDIQLVVYEIDVMYDDKGLETGSLIVANVKPTSLEKDKFDRMMKKINNSEKRLSILER